MSISLVDNAGQLLRGLKKGTDSIVRTLTLETINLSARLAQGVQTVLESGNQAMAVRALYTRKDSRFVGQWMTWCLLRRTNRIIQNVCHMRVAC